MPKRKFNPEEPKVESPAAPVEGMPTPAKKQQRGSLFGRDALRLYFYEPMAHLIGNYLPNIALNNYKAKYGRYSLCMACREGNAAMVQMLIKDGFNINKYDELAAEPIKPLHDSPPASASPLYHSMSHPEIVNILLAAGAFISKNDYAAAKRSADRDAGAQVIIAHRKNLSEKLIQAIKQKENIEQLLTLGADSEIKDENGKPALELAIEIDDYNNAQLLLKHDAKLKPDYFIDLALKEDLEKIRNLIRIAIDVNGIGSKVRTALHAAIFKNNLPLTTLLLDSGAKVDYQEAGRYNILELAFKKASIEIIELLIQKKAFIHQDIIFNILLENRPPVIIRRLINLPNFSEFHSPARMTLAITKALEDYPLVAMEFLKNKAIATNLNYPVILLTVLINNRREALPILMAPIFKNNLLDLNYEAILRIWSLDNDATTYFKNHFRVYGVPVLKVIPIDAYDTELENFIANPHPFLDSIHYPKAKKLATHILYSYHKIALINSNADEGIKVGNIRNHFVNVIKPAFEKIFDQYGKTKEEALQAIEAEIRQEILEHILENSKDQKIIDALVLAKQAPNFNEIKAGTLDFPRPLVSIEDPAQVAWRAYNCRAPVKKGTWINLLTPPSDGAREIYSIVEISGQAVKADEGSLIAREMAAYSYLLLKDNPGSPDVLKNRMAHFITQLADIRRAHNIEDGDNAPAEKDDPSCLPGVVSRVGNMWGMHPLGVYKTSLDLVPEIMQSLICDKFQIALKACKDAKERENLFEAITGLCRENAEDVINQEIIAGSDDEIIFTQNKWVLRQAFMHSVGDLDTIFQYVNDTLIKMGKAALKPSQQPFVSTLCFDSGGTWIASKLSAIYMPYVMPPAVTFSYASAAAPLIQDAPAIAPVSPKAI